MIPKTRSNRRMRTNRIKGRASPFQTSANSVFAVPRNRFGDPLPAIVRKSFSYGDFWSLSGGAAAFAANTFRINSLYDPDSTGVGGTPSGLTPWLGATGLYAKYSVVEALIEATFISKDDTPLLCGLIFGGDSAGFPSTAVQYQQAALEDVNGSCSFLAPSTQEHSTVTVSARVSMRDLLGDVANSDGNSALYNANPVNQAFANIFIVTAGADVVGATADVIVRITYFTNLMERTNLTTD